MNPTKGKIEDLFIYSHELQEEMNLLVYFPANYSPLYKYHILIAADGKDYFQFGRIGKVCDELLFNQEIENLLVVGIPYNNIDDRREKYHPNGRKHDAYIRFLALELVPFLDKELPTFQMGMGRALIGDSLGATVSLLAALKYPHTFGKVLLQSPYINDQVIRAVKDGKAFQHQSIYHVIGLDETEVKTTDQTTKDFLTPNRELNSILNKFPLSYVYYENHGEHTWAYWQKDLKRALITMFHKSS